MIDADIQMMIKQHEGYRRTVYYDTAGVPTGGYGHAFLPGSHLADETWEQIFQHDFVNAIREYELLNVELDPVRRAVLIDMLFNLGLTKMLKFKNTLAAIRAGNYELAADCMMKSKWYGQVRTRAVKLVRMMRTGEVE